MKKSVLFITNAYPDFESSYRGIFIKKMATLLHKEGFEITVVTPKIYQKSRFFENQDGIKVFRFPFLAGNKLLIEHEKVPYVRMMLYYLSGTFLTLYLFLKYRFKLIHVHWTIPTGLIGILAGFIFKKPVIVTIHGSDFRIAMEGNNAILKKIFLYVCKKASHVHCVSMVQMKKMKESEIHDRKLSVFPMGIEENFIATGQNPKKEIDEYPIKVVSNRNLLPVYNVSQLIRAIPMVLREEPKVHFIIAGDGPEREKLKQEVKALKIESSVQFLGHIEHDKIPVLLSEADIYVSTSLADGTSVSLFEAMGAGAFPVVSDIPANREWIEDGGNGFLFPVHDAGALAKKILCAIQDKSLLSNAREVNRSIVREKALWSVCIEKIKEIYAFTWTN